MVDDAGGQGEGRWTEVFPAKALIESWAEQQNGRFPHFPGVELARGKLVWMPEAELSISELVIGWLGIRFLPPPAGSCRHRATVFSIVIACQKQLTRKISCKET